MILNLKSIRESRSIEQKDLALRLNVAQSTVSMWENGKSEPRLSMLPRLAEILGCTVDELLAKEKAPPSGEGEV